MQTAHPAMDQRIADAIERRASPFSTILVDGRQIRHLPFGRSPVGSDGRTLTIAGASWSLDRIESYDPDTGDFVHLLGDSRQTVSVRSVPHRA